MPKNGHRITCEAQAFYETYSNGKNNHWLEVQVTKDIRRLFSFDRFQEIDINDEGAKFHFEFTKKVRETDTPISNIKNELFSRLINNEINYDFMNTFIEELEALRIEELEALRIEELESYLTITGLKDYNLSEDEQSILNIYNNIKFESFDITEIFNIKNTSNLLSSDIVKDSGTTPYLCASSENNAVCSYIKYDDKYIDEGNCIFIGGKTFVVTYQENDFYSNDSHNLSLYLKNETYRNKLTQLFLSTCVKKSLAHKYSWGDSISGTKIKKDIIYLPVVDGNIDYKSMKILISAVQKLVIKDVVECADKKINATKDIINNN